MIDCYSLPVDNLDGTAFYKKLGHHLLWRDGDESAGLSLPCSDDELVLLTDAEGNVMDNQAKPSKADA